MISPAERPKMPGRLQAFFCVCSLLLGSVLHHESDADNLPALSTRGLHYDADNLPEDQGQASRSYPHFAIPHFNSSQHITCVAAVRLSGSADPGGNSDKKVDDTSKDVDDKEVDDTSKDVGDKEADAPSLKVDDQEADDKEADAPSLKVDAKEADDNLSADKSEAEVEEEKKVRGPLPENTEKTRSGANTDDANTVSKADIRVADEAYMISGSSTDQNDDGQGEEGETDQDDAYGAPSSSADRGTPKP
jgi:hypothetical protein